MPSSQDGDFTSVIKAYYSERRVAVQAALDSCPFLHPDERGVTGIRWINFILQTDDSFL